MPSLFTYVMKFLTGMSSILCLCISKTMLTMFQNSYSVNFFVFSTHMSKTVHPMLNCVRLKVLKALGTSNKGKLSTFWRNSGYTIVLS